MAQFDVYRNPDPISSATIPYLLDIQADLLSDLVTRVVVPLIIASNIPKPARILNPGFTIENVKVVMSTAELAGISLHDLGELTTNLSGERDTIVAAMDLLITGF